MVRPETPGVDGGIAGSVSAWAQRHGADLVIVYGSRARADDHADSDLDLAVWASVLPAPLDRLAALNELENALGIPTQVTYVTERLDPVLGMEIAKDGQEVFSSGRVSWADRRVYPWQQYQDSRPFLDLARRSLRAYAEGVDVGS